MRYKKECKEKHGHDRDIPRCHVASASPWARQERVLPCCLQNRRFQGCGRTFSRNPLPLLFFRSYQEYLFRQHHSRMAHTASNSNHSPVSCLNLQTLQRLFFFSIFLSFEFPPFFSLPIEPSSQRAEQKARPTAYSSPLRSPRAKHFPNSFFLVCICHEQAQSFYNADTHTCALAHGNRFFYYYFFSNLWFLFSFLQKMQTKEKQGFQLKVHLFFNMKTLIELVGSPCSSGQQGPLATDRTTSGDSGAGFYLKELPYTSHEQREMDVGEGGGTVREEYERRKEKNVIGEGEDGTARGF